MSKIIFGYNNNGVNVEWYWVYQEKQYWKTWKPNATDLKVIDSTIEVRNKIHREIMNIEHPKKETKKGIYKLRR